MTPPRRLKKGPPSSQPPAARATEPSERRLIHSLLRTTRGRVIVLALWLCAAVFIGAWYGKLDSPPYDAQTPVVFYLINNFQIDSIHPDIVLTVTPGLVTYRYSLLDDKVTQEVAHPETIRGRPVPTSWNPDDYQTALKLIEQIAPPVAAATGAEVVIRRSIARAGEALNATERYTRPLTIEGRIAFYVASAVVGASGGYLGYWLTYDERKKLDSHEVESQLMNPALWKSSADYIQACLNIDTAFNNYQVIAAMDPTRVMRSQFDLVAGQHKRCAEFLKGRGSGGVKFDDHARTALALAAAFK
jgi:hypothetical protein